MSVDCAQSVAVVYDDGFPKFPFVSRENDCPALSCADRRVDLCQNIDSAVEFLVFVEGIFAVPVVARYSSAVYRSTEKSGRREDDSVS